MTTTKSFHIASALAVLLLVAVQVGCSDSRPVAQGVTPPTVNSAQAGPGTAAVSSPASGALKTALMKARDAQNDAPEIQEALRSVSSQLVAVPVATEGKDSPWTKVQLNSTGAVFDAIRFTSPLDQPADLVWSLALPQTKFTWYILPANGQMIGFRDYRQVNDVALDGVDLPPDNILVLQRLDSAQILPKQEYFLWFKLENSLPIDCYVKLKLVPAQTRTIENTYPGLAQELSIPMPFKFTSAVNLYERVDYLCKNGMQKEALMVIEEAMKTPPVIRVVRWMHAYVSHDRAFQLLQEGQTAAGSQLFLQAAAEMRKLKEDFGEFSDWEKEHVARVFYNEACALALSGKADSAIRALRDSADLGCADWEHTMQDTDLISLQSMPEFKAVVDQMKSNGASAPAALPSFTPRPRRRPSETSTN